MDSDFPETGQFQQNNLPGDFPMPSQDKIELKSNAKGKLQAEVRIGGDCSTKKAIDDLIERQKHAWDELKNKFPNLIFEEEGK